MVANDDLGNSKGFFVIAVIPVHGRLPLLKHTIERLLKKNGVYKVVCVGEGKEEKQLCESLGAVWVAHQNKPLGAKWNAGFMKASEFYFDACLFVGSSDWISDNFLNEMEPHLKENDLVGTAGCNFLHLDTLEACYWPGYVGRREGESIGIGRLISRRILHKIGYQPFDQMLDNSMDFSMVQKVSAAGGKIKTVKIKSESVSISSDKWPNKHNFKHHYTGILPSKRLENAEKWVEINFPEAKSVFNAS
jgi:hypothetical protein